MRLIMSPLLPPSTSRSPNDHQVPQLLAALPRMPQARWQYLSFSGTGHHRRSPLLHEVHPALINDLTVCTPRPVLRSSTRLATDYTPNHQDDQGAWQCNVILRRCAGRPSQCRRPRTLRPEPELPGAVLIAASWGAVWVGCLRVRGRSLIQPAIPEWPTPRLPDLGQRGASF
jgi:hypothetical protein